MYEATAPGGAWESAPAQSEGASLIGESPGFRFIMDRLPSIARAQRTTLVAGPTGSRERLVARALHEHSPRRQLRCVTVHCAALPESLVEAEMFGHSRGAFTGATQSRAGLIRCASSGTLFLDEIDSLPASAQAKLLRFLETGEYRAWARTRWSTPRVGDRRHQPGSRRAGAPGHLPRGFDVPAGGGEVELPPLNQRPHGHPQPRGSLPRPTGRGDKRFTERRDRRWWPTPGRATSAS